MARIAECTLAEQQLVTPIDVMIGLGRLAQPNVDTDYDDLLMSGVDREDARHRVRDRVDRILDTWRDGATDLDA